MDSVVAAERTFGDDLSMTAAIAIARDEGHDDEVRRYVNSINARRDSQTGLVRSARPEGDIETTFVALQIAPEMFRGPTARSTAQVMRDDLNVGGPRLDATTRLKALAILRAAGGPDWTRHRAEITDAMSDLRGTPVTEGSLQSTVETVHALRLLDPNVPQPTVQPFAARDPRSEHLARLALANADMFANSAQLKEAFRRVVPQLVREARDPKDPLVAYYTSLNAIAGAGVQPDVEDHRTIVSAVRGLQGCSLDGHAHPYLFRAAAAPREPCSLEATWQAIRSGYAYEGSR